MSERVENQFEKVRERGFPLFMTDIHSLYRATFLPLSHTPKLFSSVFNFVTFDLVLGCLEVPFKYGYTLPI